MTTSDASGSGGEWRPTFWVVERFENDKSIGYWDGGHSRAFVTDIDKAVQFCRRQDAMWTIVGWHWKDVQITEHAMLASPSPSLTEEEIARAIYEQEPFYEGGEYDEGFAVSPGGNLTWEQACTRDAEFEDDPRMGSITKFARDAARVVMALIRGRS